MTGPDSRKNKTLPGRVVGVIASRAALAAAARLRRPPDFFELRLDALRHSLGEVERVLPRLRAPLLLTARHPAEGGRGDLDPVARRALFERFLDSAAAVDLELRSLRQMPRLLEQIRQRNLLLVLSVHHLGQTPPPNDLRREAEAAATAGAAIFKVATRTDAPAELGRLVAFFEESRQLLPIAAMGIGRRGAESRRRLGLLGSVLHYVSLGPATSEGQPIWSKLRRTRPAYIE